MKPISLTINGRGVRAEVEARLNLADFLREHQFLTATHVGCEHGVCGACTVLVDGAPARSCLTFAVAADRAEITTLEGFERDATMDALREAFADNHGLQCGYCTPGMLMTARDVLTRLPDADEKRIRLELAGNLCRCTGYVGIVKAIQSTQAQLKSSGGGATPAARRIGPVGSHPPIEAREHSHSPASGTRAPNVAPAPAVAENIDQVDWAAVEREGVELRQTFTVPFARADVWRFFADLDQVTRCMPGARLTRPVQSGRTEGEINVKLGPIVSAFHGALEVTRDDAKFRGIVRGAGRDAKSPSSARAIIRYDVHDQGMAASRVDVAVTFVLSGALAQFSRSGLARDVADHLTRMFAANLEARLSGKPIDADAGTTLDAAAIARSAIWSRITAWLGRLLRR